jgi:hypothetical protein
MMENGKKLEFPEGQEGVRGLESASRILMTRGSLYLMCYLEFFDFLITTFWDSGGHMIISLYK